MDWLESLGSLYDEYVAPTVGAVKDFASGAWDTVQQGAQDAGSWAWDTVQQGAQDAGSWANQNLSDAGGWAQQQMPSGMAGPNAGAETYTGPMSSNWNGAGATPTVQGASQGTTSFTGNFGNSGGGGDPLTEFIDRGYKNAPTVVQQAATAVQPAFDYAKNAMGEIRQFGKENAPAIGMAAKLYGGYKQSQAADEYQRSLAQQAGRESQVNEANRAIVDERNTGARDVNAEQRARIGMAGMQAQRGSDAATARQLGAIASSTKIDPTAKAALAQKAKVSGSMAGASAFNQADTSARAGLRAPELGQYGQPTAQYSNAAAQQQYRNDSNVAPYADVANDMFGLSQNKVKNEVGV